MSEPYLFESLPLSALVNVMPAASRPGARCAAGTMLKNERYHFQVAVKAALDDKAIVNVQVDADPAIRGQLSVFEVKLMPSELIKLSLNDPRDTNFISNEPGLFPDLLQPIHPVGLSLTPKLWRAVWLTLDGTGTPLAPGSYPVTVRFTQNGQDVARSRHTITVCDAELPSQQMIYTNWFHLDSLMEYYGVEAFSDRHWALIENFLRMAVSRGMNMVLTPCFTPPLDTAVGGERPTVQLVDVNKTGEKYSFSFERLNRFVALCQRCGIRYFEIAHLFTQWGARHAPKIMATVNGEAKRIFGWDTDAAGPEYEAFLKAYIPQLVNALERLGIKDKSFFHVSDEPTMANLEQYKKASTLLNSLIGDMKTIDALSDYSFYEQGLVKLPIPTTHSVDEFRDNGVNPLWCYYCAFSSDFLTMRYFSVPSARNRVFGSQLYKYDIQGFLHWGFNFYFAQHSRYPVNPFQNTDSGGWCPSGDAYMVYPGPDGRPLPSTRLEVFYDGIQDMLALRALEQKIGRERVLQLLDEDLFKPLSMYDYPKDAEWILGLRAKVNALLAEK